MIKGRAGGRSRTVKPSELRSLETRRFKARGELLAFALMNAINTKDLDLAMDTLAQRVVTVQHFAVIEAKSKEGTWEKAEKLELTGGASSGGTATGGMLRLSA